MNFDHIKSALKLEQVAEHYGVKLRKSGLDLEGLCPFHTERTPSFKITTTSQLWYCHGACGAGGSVIDFVARKRGVTPSDAAKILADEYLISDDSGLAGNGNAERKGYDGGGSREMRSVVNQKPAPEPAQPEMAEKTPRGPAVAWYDYTDEAGVLLYQSVRFEPGENGRKKDFLQRRPNGNDWIWSIKEVRNVWYRLPKVIQADTIYLVEGEKDVHSLEILGYVATTNSGGANNKPTDEMCEFLRGKRVILLPDQDEAGRRRGKELAVALTPIAAELITVDVPGGKDVTDWLELGNDAAALDMLVQERENQQRRDSLERGGLASPFDVIMLAGGPSAFLAKREPGIPTGFRDYDYHTGGLYGGEVTIWAARPGVGKTSLMMQAVLHCTRKIGAALVFSLEMSRRLLLTRLVCTEARVSMHTLRTGRMSEQQRRSMQTALAEIAELPLFIDDTAMITPRDMRLRIDKFSQKHTPRFVAIDYLQLASGSGKTENRNQEVSAMSREVKIIARDMNLPFVVLSQLSRGVESRLDRSPQLSDLRDSGSIEQDADLVVFIHRPEMYKKNDESLRGLAELIIAKHRNGGTPTLKMRFFGEHTRFEDASNLAEVG